MDRSRVLWLDMDSRRTIRRALLAIAVAALVPPASLALPGSALGAQSGITGSLYDATCPVPCAPPCVERCIPPCPAPCQSNVICAQPQTPIVCPQLRSPKICLPVGCGVEYPLYTGEDATITVRRAGSENVLKTVKPDGGHFSIELGAGRYAIRGHVAQPCWEGEKAIVTVFKGRSILVALDVRNACVVHPDESG